MRSLLPSEPPRASQVQSHASGVTEATEHAQSSQIYRDRKCLKRWVSGAGERAGGDECLLWAGFQSCRWKRSGGDGGDDVVLGRV